MWECIFRPVSLKFLRRLNEEFPGPVLLHLVMDNCFTHNQPEVTVSLFVVPKGHEELS